MKNLKKIFMIFICFIFVFNFCIVSASEISDESVESFIPTQIGEIWEENGISYTVVESLPVVWEINEPSISEGIAPASVIPITITVSIGYIGNGKINCIISAAGGANALLKYINGTISTWGVAGSHSAISFSDSNLIPMSRITAEATFNYLYLTQTGTQYTRTQGTVTDVYGNTGSFGPSEGSATIRP